MFRVQYPLIISTVMSIARVFSQRSGRPDESPIHWIEISFSWSNTSTRFSLEDSQVYRYRTVLPTI